MCVGVCARAFFSLKESDAMHILEGEFSCERDSSGVLGSDGCNGK